MVVTRAPELLFQPYSTTRADRYPVIFRFVRDALGDAPSLRLLSFGCSSGEEVWTLRRYFAAAFIKGIDIDPANGNLLISAREMDSVFYLERSTGKVLWKLGGSSFTKDHARYLSAKDPFYRQHDGRLQPGWSATTCGGKGQISVYDDHSYVKGPSRGVVYDVVVGEEDGGCGTAEAGATVVWQFDGTGNSNDRGSFRISADGSRIIGWGTGHQRNLVFTEVDDAGQPLLNFYFGDGDVSYRAVKVPLTAFDLNALRSTAGQPY